MDGWESSGWDGVDDVCVFDMVMVMVMVRMIMRGKRQRNGV